MDTLSYIIGRNSSGGGTGSTPTWSDVTGKPFSTVGEGLEVSDGALKECVPVYVEQFEGERETLYYQYDFTLSNNAYVAPVDNDWRELNQYQNPSMQFSWEDGQGNKYTLSTSFDLSSPDDVYTDDGNYNWKISMQGNAHVNLVLECQDTLPAEAQESTSGSVEVYFQDIIYDYHQLPAEYIQIDGSTIVNENGYLTANIPTVPVVSATATLGSGTEVGSITIDGETTTLYAPTPSVVTASASTLTTGTVIGSIEIDGVTTTFKGEYVPHKTSQLTNDADFLSAQDTGITNTLSSGTAIGDLTIYGVTTTLYAPAGGTAATPNWNATSGQEGYIDNKPSIIKGGANTSVRMCYGGTGQINGNYAIAIGKDCWTTQDYDFAQGEGIQVMSPHQHIQGKYNIQNYQGTIFADIIGNGTSSARSNAEATDWSGNKYLAGDIYVGVTNWADPQNNATKLANIPAAPTTTAATLTLQATVDGSGNVTYAWV